MSGQEANTLRQIVADQAERLNSVHEQVTRAKCALLDHDLDRMRYWLAQIESTSRALPSLPPLPQATERQYAGIVEG
jgi:hypothetical protein